MPISQALMLALAGGALGVIFFGGLWWTVQRGVASKSPGMWFFASLQLRMLATLAGFFFLIAGHAERIIPSLIGFLIARFAVMYGTKGASFSHLPSTESESQ